MRKRNFIKILLLFILVILLIKMEANVSFSNELSDKRKLSLTIEERVNCQLAIEKVYWRHRIWPKENKRQKPAIESVVSKEFLRKKVEDSLRMSNAIKFYTGRDISGKQIQEEMNRISRNTKQPTVLREIWEALGNEPYLIAECLIRPLLAERNLRDIYKMKKFFNLEDRGIDLKRQAKEDFSKNDKIRNKIIEVEFQEWWRMNESEFDSVIEGSNFNYFLPVITLMSCSDDSWEGISWVPMPKSNHTAVWTGTEMIIWSGLDANSNYLNSGAKYNPATDAWQPINIMGAPPGRINATAIWTGSEMIVWAGNDAMDFFRSGGRYNPVTDTWTSTSMSNAPSKRIWHAAVWTGTDMIIWGGYYTDHSYDYFYNDGAKYNPASNSWTPITDTGAPTARCLHSFVWIGTEMIVWGGFSGLNFEGDGGRYDPVTDSWTPVATEGAPSARWRHTAVWTGTKMIVWGGQDDNGDFLNTGGRYDPLTDLWTSTSVENVPEERYRHTAVWTGSQMIIWGGFNGTLPETAGKYDPVSDSWSLISTENSPISRLRHSAVWTGTEMIVWGGFFGDFTNTGGRYNPMDDTWISTFATDSLSERWYHTAVWTGVEMIIWGGADSLTYLDTGAKYYPSLDIWIYTSMYGVPAARWRHTAIWTGQEMIIWGGSNGEGYFFTGARYNPITDQWIPTSMEGTPSERQSHTAIWTGSEMIIWGGEDGNFYLNTGGKYNPVSDQWTDVTTVDAPSGRVNHIAIFSGSEMIIWGGFDGSFLNSGSRYNSELDLWQVISQTDTPEQRYNHTAIWDGDKMIIWGGFNEIGYLNSGGIYDPVMDSWTATPLNNAPTGRETHSALWTGSEMIIWGGNDGSGCVNTGARLSSSGWMQTSAINVPNPRCNHIAVLTGEEMIVWGGVNDMFFLNNGARYCIGQTIPMLQAHNLTIDDSGTNHNNMIEPDEIVTLVGTLTNVSTTQATSVSGDIFSYDPITIITPNAQYPDITPGDSQTCTDCYTVVAPSTNRSSRHWDIKITEIPQCTGCSNTIYSTHFHIGKSFNDVPPSYIFYKYIEAMFHWEMTSGCSNLNYCPNTNVARQAMAKFICNAMNVANPNSCYTFGCSEIFGDVMAANPFCEYIEALYNAGVVSGCKEDPLLYCPSNLVSRQAMAKFVCLGMEASMPGACTTFACQEIFTDVLASNFFCSYIEALYNANIISGCGPSLYCPTLNVTRGQMAKFIINAFGLNL